MKLSGARATCGALSGAMAQFINQVLTWYLTNGNAYDCVQAMVSFSWEGNALGAKARCYLSHDSSGQAPPVRLSGASYLISFIPGIDVK